MIGKIIKYTVLTLLVLSVAAYLMLRASLPELRGEIALTGLSEPVYVVRDDRGWPKIKVKSRADAAQALGFLHAQERFFQMDLLRRLSAGELSELFGEKTLELDKTHRQHQFRQRATLILSRLAKNELELLKRYTDGVNQGLATLGLQPFEYLLLFQGPEPWRMEDSILVVFSMYLRLQGDNSQERQIGFLKDQLSLEQFEFLVPTHSQWDAPLFVDKTAGDKSSLKAEIPNPPTPPAMKEQVKPTDPTAALLPFNSIARHPNNRVVGSNGFAVSKRRSRNQQALVANDMHLGLSLPNTWYLATIEQQHLGKMASGATLPGAPLIIVGMTEFLAWGFTNSYGDWHDWVVVELNEEGKSYRTVDGWKPLEIEKEKIVFGSEKSVEIEVKLTKWGPILSEDHQGRPLAYRWVAHDREAVSLGLLALESAENIQQALQAMGPNVGIPAQNIMLADVYGNIAWTIAGPIPKRKGLTGRWPVSWADGDRGWDGYLPAKNYPIAINPPDEFIFTANNRIVSGQALSVIGHGNYAVADRAGQIKYRLSEKERHSVESLQAIQLDDESRFMERWFDLAIRLLENVETSARLERARKLIKQKKLAARPGSVGLLLVTRFRTEVMDGLVKAWLSPLANNFADFDYYKATRWAEDPLWTVINNRADLWLPSGFDNWDDFLLSMLQKAIKVEEDGSDPFDDSTDMAYRVTIGHPITSSIPGMGWLTNPGTAYLPGSRMVPRVQGERFGASIRFVLAPGDFDRSRFSMPGGQSGHPLSPYYLDGHDLWEAGEYRGLSSGEPSYRLELLPQ